MFNMGEDMMKQWAENWEKMMGDQLEKVVKNEKFMSEMAKSIAATMTGKAFYTKAVDQQLASMNLPSRTEVVKVLQKLTDVEERLIDLSERFEDFADMHNSKLEKMEKAIEAFGMPAKTQKNSKTAKPANKAKSATATKSATSKLTTKKAAVKKK